MVVWGLPRGESPAFGMALRTRGWRIVYLGPDTPIASVTDAARMCGADLVVLSAVAAETFDRHAGEPRRARTLNPPPRRPGCDQDARRP